MNIIYSLMPKILYFCQLCDSILGLRTITINLDKIKWIE